MSTIQGSAKAVSTSITAENTFSDEITVRGLFNLSLSGTWVGTVTLQRSFDGSTWLDVAEYTANIQDVGEEAELGVLYRVGVPTGGYTSGTMVARISQ